MAPNSFNWMKHFVISWREYRILFIIGKQVREWFVHENETGVYIECIMNATKFVQMNSAEWMTIRMLFVMESHAYIMDSRSKHWIWLQDTFQMAN